MLTLLLLLLVVLVLVLQYLSDVDCPLELAPGGSNLQSVLQWLINYAVSLEYADAGMYC